MQLRDKNESKIGKNEVMDCPNFGEIDFRCCWLNQKKNQVKILNYVGDEDSNTYYSLKKEIEY